MIDARGHVSSSQAAPGYTGLEDGLDEEAGRQGGVTGNSYRSDTG